MGNLSIMQQFSQNLADAQFVIGRGLDGIHIEALTKATNRAISRQDLNRLEDAIGALHSKVRKVIAGE